MRTGRRATGPANSLGPNQDMEPTRTSAIASRTGPSSVCWLPCASHAYCVTCPFTDECRFGYLTNGSGRSNPGGRIARPCCTCSSLSALGRAAAWPQVAAAVSAALEPESAAVTGTGPAVSALVLRGTWRGVGSQQRRCSGRSPAAHSSAPAWHPAGVLSALRGWRERNRPGTGFQRSSCQLSPASLFIVEQLLESIGDVRR
jgi:hypothetical protein